MAWRIELGRPIWRVGVVSWSLDEMFRDREWAEQQAAELELVAMIEARDAAAADEEG